MIGAIARSDGGVSCEFLIFLPSCSSLTVMAFQLLAKNVDKMARSRSCPIYLPWRPVAADRDRGDKAIAHNSRVVFIP